MQAFQRARLQRRLTRQQRDADTVESCYQNALRLSPQNPEILNNHGVALSHLGYFSRAADLMLLAYRLEPDNLYRVHAAIAICAAAGRFQRLAELLDIWKKLNPDSLPEEYARYFDMRRQSNSWTL
ncbi:MAG: hypothetical protein GY862_27880 [Gammaproteobacteria bacterium]|nr:hypothetical protein [Gammaproteobacteria bacterium]